MRPMNRVNECLQYYTENMGLGHQGSRDGNVTAATNKAHNPALQRGFSGGGKKVEYTMPRT